MPDVKRLLQPTLSQLLGAEALSEAQVLTGDDFMDREIVQVISSLQPAPRANSLLVSRAGALSVKDIEDAPNLSGIIVIKPLVVASDLAAASGMNAPATGATQKAAVDPEIKKLTKVCQEYELPLVLVPGFGDPAQIAEDIRQAFLSELKRTQSLMHAHLLSLVLESGLAGLAEEMAERVGRPLVIETADFKVLASQNMGPTPANQQRSLVDQISQALAKETQDSESNEEILVLRQPVRLGRRLVVPVLLKGMAVGYMSVVVRPNDDVESIFELLIPAALAAMVDISNRSKELSAFAATFQNLLKDLIAGHSLSTTDFDRLDRHFGFDICDGLLVLAVQVVAGQLPTDRLDMWPQDRFVTVEAEGTRAFIIPINKKAKKTWQQEADVVLQTLKKGNAELKLQVGAGRLVETSMDLADAYREARQALIISSMISGDAEFTVGYGDLGIRRLLYLMIDHPEVERFCEENLLPLETYDEEWETELIPTLRVYLKEGANLNSAARELFIHRHTLRYRLEQIAEILNVDIDSQDVLLNLQIALLIKDMKGTIES